MNYNENASGVYMLTNQVTGKIYVGSSHNIGRRWYKHFEYPLHNTCTKLRNAIMKHGKGAFVATVLEITPPTKLALLEREQYFLDALQPFGEHGYNIRKIAGSNLGVRHTAETRHQWSVLKQGENNPMWGKRGRTERKRLSDEKRTGQKRTDGQKAKMGKHLAVGVTAFNKDGSVYKAFTSQADAVREVNGDPTAMWKCLTKQPNFNSHKGYVWCYTSDVDITSTIPNSL